MNKEDMSSLVVGFVLGLPLLSVLADGILFKIIGIFWGWLAWALIVWKFEEEKHKQKVI